MIREFVNNVKRDCIVDNDCAVSTRCYEFRAVMREFQEPHLVGMLTELNSCLRREITPITEMFGVERRRNVGVVI